MFTKAKICNLALGALLLQRQLVNPDTDQSNEAKVLNQYYDIAWRTALADMDLDGTSSQIQLQLIQECPIHHWKFAYQYPSDCIFFRRIKSHFIMDNRSTHIPKRVAQFNGQKVIFTDKCDAVAEYISTNLQLSTLSPSAGMAISYRLAVLSAPLVTGKGAKSLLEGVAKSYVIAKAEAQAQDERENFVFESEALRSEFVQTRLSSDSDRGDY